MVRGGMSRETRTELQNLWFLLEVGTLTTVRYVVEVV